MPTSDKEEAVIDHGPVTIEGHGTYHHRLHSRHVDADLHCRHHHLMTMGMVIISIIIIINSLASIRWPQCMNLREPQE